MSLRDLLKTADPLTCARRVLGCEIAYDGMRARIVETEAYHGSQDPGSHAFRGMTPRTKVMFGPPGHAYVYFTYGNHWMLNVVARPDGEACAILIRAAEPLEGLEKMRPLRAKAKTDRDLLSGPGKLCQAMGIDKSLYGVDLFDENSPLRLHPGEPVEDVLVTPRIGIAKGKGDELPWRFVDAANRRWASR